MPLSSTMSFQRFSQKTSNPAFLAVFWEVGEVKNVDDTGMLYALAILSLKYIKNDKCRIQLIKFEIVITSLITDESPILDDDN